MDRFTEIRITQTEYEIRKTERAVKIMSKQGDDPKLILERAEKLNKLKNELEELAGRRIPNVPEWPV